VAASKAGRKKPSAREPKVKRPQAIDTRIWKLGIPSVALVIVAVVALALRKKETMCGAGQLQRDGVCVPSEDPVDKYARCIIRDAKQHLSTDVGTSIEGTIDAEKTKAKSTIELKDRFEKTVEASPDRCIILDVSAKCYALASGTAPVPLVGCSSGVPALPVPSVIPTASASGGRVPTLPPFDPVGSDARLVMSANGGSNIVNMNQMGGQVAHQITNIGTQPRVLTTPTVNSIVTTLAHLPTEQVELRTLMTDVESAQLGKQVAGLLRQAGWTVYETTFVPQTAVAGVVVVTMQPAHDGFTQLIVGLQQAGLRTHGELQTVRLTMVGKTNAITGLVVVGSNLPP
jgi:hypothetical protein